jgi:hypothetical protein
MYMYQYMISLFEVIQDFIKEIYPQLDDNFYEDQ